MSNNFDSFRADYQAVAASLSNQPLVGQFGKGGKGDIIDRLIIIPASVSPGAITLADGGGVAMTIFPGGANSLTELKPIYVEIGARSINGAWQVTTGASVSIIAVGRFQ